MGKGIPLWLHGASWPREPGTSPALIGTSICARFILTPQHLNPLL
jgi:hypothetical protein